MAPKNTKLRSTARRARLAVKYEWIARARRAPIKQDTVLYESFSGNGMLDNPEAIFRALLRADDLGQLKHVWVLADLEEHADTVAEFADHPRVHFVEYASPAYYTALATAKYLVNNATFPPEFGKREGQVYVNTWHGTPLKAMGYDITGGAVDTRNVVRNLVAADYLLAGNEATAEMYLTAYRMRNIFRGRLVQEGSPRVDRQFASDGERAQVRSRLRAAGVTLGEDQEILLYAPTWKGSFYAPTNDIRQLRARLDALAGLIDTNRYKILLKVHQQVYKYAIADERLRGMLVPNDLPTNVVLAATDALVTDYSSIFIDFLATGRPILFFTPDLADYESSRGFYLPFEQWPGPLCREVTELAEQVNRLGTGTADDPVVAFAKAYEDARGRYCSSEDGAAADRVVDIVFRGRTDGYNVREDFFDGRTSVLIHLGGMLANGITASALCLLDNIDYDRFDVSVTFPHSTSEQRARLIQLINPQARLFPRIGGINGSKLEVVPLLSVKNRLNRSSDHTLARYEHVLRDEWVRCYGDSRFDHVVDFSGYAPFWVQMFSQRRTGTLSVWLHNDMHAEANSPGRSPHLRASVAAVCALYKHADHLVSVSPALSDVNRTKLAESAPPQKFTCARNTINYQRVLELAYGLTAAEGAEVEDGSLDVLSNDELARPSDDDVVEMFHPRDLRGSLERLASFHGMAQVQAEVERRATIQELLPPEPRVRTFVTAGRLSAEKNHERLIRAFDRIHQEDPDTRLVILGTGVLRARLETVIEELGLTAAVTLAGFRANPYGVLAHSDCFVLSSDYEGQPMVLLEALILGLPVITTEFGSVRGSMPEGYGRIVERNVGGLVKGMREFLRGKIASRPFDYLAYNREATEEFYRAIGA